MPHAYAEVRLLALLRQAQAGLEAHCIGRVADGEGVGYVERGSMCTNSDGRDRKTNRGPGLT